MGYDSYAAGFGALHMHENVKRNVFVYQGLRCLQ